MYEAGLRPTALPVDVAVSMGVHESQSLFWERHIGLSRPFWTWAGPRVREALGVQASDDDLYAAANAVQQKSLIRVEADELTYPMHVILRFEVERALMRGEISGTPSRLEVETSAVAVRCACGGRLGSKWSGGCRLRLLLPLAAAGLCRWIIILDCPGAGS